MGGPGTRCQSYLLRNLQCRNAMYSTSMPSRAPTNSLLGAASSSSASCRVPSLAIQLKGDRAPGRMITPPFILEHRPAYRYIATSERLIKLSTMSSEPPADGCRKMMRPQRFRKARWMSVDSEIATRHLFSSHNFTHRENRAIFRADGNDIGRRGELPWSELEINDADTEYLLPNQLVVAVLKDPRVLSTDHSLFGFLRRAAVTLHAATPNGARC